MTRYRRKNPVIVSVLVGNCRQERAIAAAEPLAPVAQEPYETYHEASAPAGAMPDNAAAAGLTRPGKCARYGADVLMKQLTQGYRLGAVVGYPLGEPDNPGSCLIEEFEQSARQMLTAVPAAPAGALSCDGFCGGCGNSVHVSASFRPQAMELPGLSPDV